MGKYVDNRTSASNRAKMKRKASVVDVVAWDMKPKYFNAKQTRKSQAQARTDGSLQAKIVAEREARLNNR